MFFRSWRQWLNQTFRSLRRNTPFRRDPQHRYRPLLLRLEDRITPSTYQPTTPTDFPIAGAGISSEYVNVQERDDHYLRARTAEYVQRLKVANKYEERIREMEPVWQDALKRRIAEAEARLDAAKQAVKDAKGDEVKKQKQQDLDALEARIKLWKSDKGKEQLRKEWEAGSVVLVE